jgi:N-sulfoglucosamine sulfohydrolase
MMQGMDRRDFVKGAATLAATGLAAKAWAQPGDRRPSVLVLFTDDHGPHMGCLGTLGLRTPHFDDLAGSGTLFTNAYAPCASCSPSRAALLTGRYPSSNGLWRNVVAPTLADPPVQFTRESTKVDTVGTHEAVPTLVEMLRAEGIRSGIMEKFHLSPPWKYRFDWKLPTAAIPKHRARATRQFLEATDDSEPFFLLANIGTTHRPFRPIPPEMGLPYVDPALVEVPAYLPDVPAVREDWAHYLSTVQVSDACAGATLQTLEDMGRLEDTWVIMAADQGPPFQRAKATTYEAGIRIPMIVRPPGGSDSILSSEPANLIDVLPTLCEMWGMETPAGVEGTSLMPLVRGEAESLGRQHVFAEHNSHGLPLTTQLYPSRSVSDGRLKYIRNLMPEKRYEFPADLDTSGDPWFNRTYPATLEARDEFPLQYERLMSTHERPPEELYDLHSDPDELRNLAGDPVWSEDQARLAAELDRWIGEVGLPDWS